MISIAHVQSNGIFPSQALSSHLFRHIWQHLCVLRVTPGRYQYRRVKLNLFFRYRGACTTSYLVRAIAVDIQTTPSCSGESGDDRKDESENFH